MKRLEKDNKIKMRKMRCESYRKCTMKEEKKRWSRKREVMLGKRRNCIENWEKENEYFLKKIMMYHTFFYNCHIWHIMISCLFSQLSYATDYD